MSLTSPPTHFLRGLAPVPSSRLRRCSGRRTTGRMAALAPRARHHDDAQHDSAANAFDEEKHGPRRRMVQRLVSGVAAASLIANVAVVPVALARASIDSASAEQLEGSRSVSRRLEATLHSAEVRGAEI